MKTTSHEIPRCCLARLEDEVKRINRRAERLGCPPVVLRKVREFQVERRGELDVFATVVEFVEVEVSGEAPSVAGWTFAGAIDHLAELPVLRVLEGFSPPVEYRTATAHCDHCGLNRQRKSTYLLVNEAGEWRQVGSSCLGDFTGRNDPHTAAAYLEILLDVRRACADAEDEAWGGGNGGGFSGWEVETFLAWTAKAIRENGWTPRSKADEFAGRWATSAIVTMMLDKVHAHARGRTDKRPDDPTEADVQAAQRAAQWALSQDIRTCSDYLANCHAVVAQGYVPLRHAGIAASVVATYQRDQAERSRFVPGHFGEPGKRGKFMLTCVDWRVVPGVGFDGQGKVLVRFRDEQGRLGTWWTTGDIEWLQRGEAMQVKATVKRHGSFRGQDQTDLQRVVPVA